MADVYCANCGEPWDTVHLREDAIWDGVSENLLEIEDIEKWNGSLQNKKVKSAFTQLGWKFAGSIFAVLQCPDCKRKQAMPDADERRGMATLAAELLGDDEDALICMIEDCLKV